MAIQVMVGVVEEGRFRVLDFLLPSWLHGQVITFVGRETGDPVVLEPIEYLDWSAYGGTSPYRPCSRDRVAAAVGEVVRVLRESGALFTPSNPSGRIRAG